MHCAAAVLLILLLGWFGWRILRFGGTRFDDAYMFLRYAHNLLRGYGFSWNPGEGPVYGITSIGYTVVVAAVRAVFGGADPGLLLTRISGVFGIAAIVLMAAAAARGASGPLRSVPVSGVIIAPFFVFGTAWYFHSTSGMETTLAVAMNAVFVLALLRLRDIRTPAAVISAAVAAYAVFLVRPDNGLYAVVLPGLLLGMAWRIERRRFVLFYAVLLALLAVDSGLKLAAFGNVLPLSHFVKRPLFYEGYAGVARWNPVRYLVDFLLAAAPFWIALTLTISRRRAIETAAFLAPVAATAAYHLRVLPIMGDYYRFLAPAWPFVVAPAMLCLDDALMGFRRTRHFPVRHTAARIAVAVLLLVLVFVLGKVGAPWYRDRLLANPEGYQRISFPGNMPSQLGWFRANRAAADLASALPPGTLFAASEVGLLGAMNPDIPILDLVGLHDPYIARHGFSAAYVLDRAPAVIWFPHPEYTRMVRELASSDTFQREYLFQPGALDYGIAVRRDKTDIRDIVTRELGRIYGER